MTASGFAPRNPAKLPVFVVLALPLIACALWLASRAGSITVAPATHPSEVDLTPFLASKALDEGEIHVLEGERATHRLVLATTVLVEPKYSACWKRADPGHDPAVQLQFPAPNKWGSAVNFIYNVTHPTRSTFLVGETGKPASGFVEEVHCSDKSVSAAYQFLKMLLQTLQDLGHIPLWPD